MALPPLALTIARPAQILYCRLPGLLALTARQGRGLPESAPVAVTLGREVRDACPVAVACGVHPGESLPRARRLCPALFAVPLEELDAADPSARFLSSLADLTPTVEPDGPDAAYANLSGCPPADLKSLLRQWADLGAGLTPVLGDGPSKNAARACAECGLSQDRFTEADSRWLWPEDTTVIARLYRLGLSTYGEVAAAGEEALVYQLGKVGRLVYLRANGRDLTPVRALWPRPEVEALQDFTLDPVEDERTLRESLRRLSIAVSRSLYAVRRYARRLRMEVSTEQGTPFAEWVLPAPVQAEGEVRVALRRLRDQIRITAPVIRLRTVASDLDLPPAQSGDLFDSGRAEQGLALAAARQKLCARYGVNALKYLVDVPVPRGEIRRALRQERLRS